MASIRKLIPTFACALLVVSPVASRGSTFLRSGEVTLGDAESSLQDELAGRVGAERLAELREMLRPTFAALPKNAGGHLGHQAMRYALHRLFVQRRGWFVKGLEPDGDVWHTRGTVESLKEWVPSYLLGRLEERVGGRGVDLDDLAALAAALEDLIRQEAVGRFEAVYRTLGLPTGEAVSADQVKDALDTYLIVYLVGGNFSARDAQDAARKRLVFAKEYTGWSDVEAWLRGVERSRLGGGGASSAQVRFATASEVAVEVGAQYGTFNDLECADLKATLLGMQGRSGKPGRVRLPDFYRKGLHSHWGFTEKRDYLRVLGSLDESNMSNPMVIVPNYLGARPNCLESSDLYAVCCRNECEDLMGHLERTIAKSSAAPNQIANLVEGLSSPTVSAPRKLPPGLRGRLDEIAQLHGGEVGLHGRLFAQWMHHAFPNECPYPHEAGTTSPLTPDEWIGADVSASEEERRRYVESDTCGADGPEASASHELPWSHAEELLAPLERKPAPPAEQPRRRSTGASGCSMLLLPVAAAVAALAALVAQEQHPGELSKPRAPAVCRELVGLAVRCGVSWQLLAVLAIALAALGLDLLDRFVFGLALAGGALAAAAGGALGGGCGAEASQAKAERCCAV